VIGDDEGLLSIPMELPIKLKDANTETIKGNDYLTIQVNYPKDTWTFFLNKEDYSL
tara:strand:+ start:1655 stop:1822 length:168 start_codon:yes stop_codon:yes gene_type:complete